MTRSNFIHTKRRGLSTIVGALIFVVLMVATFSVLGIALSSQTDIVDTNREVSNQELAKQQEDWGITVSTDSTDNQRISINVQNNGQNPVEIFSFVLTNSTDVANNYPTQVFDVTGDASFVAPSFTEDILETNPLYLSLAAAGETELYEFKVISSNGIIKKESVLCDENACNITTGATGLAVQLIADGPTGINTKTSTILMFVTNTGDNTLTGITPDRGFPPADTGDADSDPECKAPLDFWTADSTEAEENLFIEDIEPCEVDPTTGVDLDPGEFAIFSWDGVVNGDIGVKFTFCNSVTSDAASGSVSSNVDCDTLDVINPNDCDGCGEGGGDGSTLILIDDLLTRPSLFMVIPSPMGDNAGSDQSVWGVNLVNPTEVDMLVSKLTIVVYPPTANDNDAIIPSQGNPLCNLTEINPTDGMWNCPKENTILWQNQAAPVLLEARSAEEFLVAVEPGTVSGSGDIDALIVQANVFTTLGSFGKGEGYQTTMRDGVTSMVNVFLSNTIEDRDDFHGVRDDGTLVEQVESTLRLSIADMDDSDTTFIKNGTKFIINVPRKWTDVAITSDNGFENCTVCSPDDRILALGDGSHQISLVTEEDIGGAGDKDVLTVEFTATPPCNEISDEKRPYIMYVLADGLENNDFPIGPLNEVALVVEPEPAPLNCP